MTKISVIIPIYNEEKYLEECLESVVNQTLKDIEIICVNDGSTDRSKEIIDRYAAKDERIKAIHKKNTGNGNTMNCGLEAATGEYIGIVESDDFIVEDMYEKLFSLTQNGSVDIVKGNFWDCYDEVDGSITKVVNQERKNMPDIDITFNIREYPQILWGHPSIWSAIYRRELIEKNHIRFKEVKGAGWVDNPFFFTVFGHAKTIRWTKEPFYCYRKLNLESSSKGYDLAIPFERMIDNLNALKNNNYNDEEILKFAYARALMYLIGATWENHYPENVDYARPYMQKMLNQMNEDVIMEDFNLNDQKNFQHYRSPLATLMPKVAKILIYNWVPFDNPGKVGGGVSIYCKNLIEALMKNRPDATVYFLSSGWAYDVTRDECYIRQLDNVFGERCRSFEIVNSPVPAPQDRLFLNPEVGLKNEELKNVFRSFIEKNGPFNVIHFNNMEGLSMDVFELKKEFEETKFIYSLHNYAPFCMTGFYFQRHNHCNCMPGRDVKECEACVNKIPVKRIMGSVIDRAKFNVYQPERFDEYKWALRFGFDRLDQHAEKMAYQRFTECAVNTLNENMDLILAVSERVKEIAEENGVDKSKLRTSYIGTKIADFQVKTSIAPRGKYFNIAFLGSGLDYEEKGYPFILNALEQLDEGYAQRIDLILTTTTQGRDEYVQNKLKKYHHVELIHGYTHKDLKNILRTANLGIIPVLWEDNLPQIAIEMVAMGVPILCSDAGGAHELCESAEFIFEAGNAASFGEKIKYFVNNPQATDKFWKYHQGLVTMQKHFKEISAYYELPEETEATISVHDYALLLRENEFLYRNLNTQDGFSQEANEQIRRRDEEIRQKSDEVNYLRNELETIRNQRDYLQYVIDETRQSKSYKIGLAVTAVPRKLRGDK